MRPFNFAIDPKSSSTQQSFDNPIMTSQSDFSGGINKSKLQSTIDPEKEVYESINAIVNISSQLTTRSGISKIDSFMVNESNPNYPNGTLIQGIGEYKDSVLVATGGEVYICDEVETSDSISGEVFKSATNIAFIGDCHPTNKVNFLQFHGYVLIMDGGVLKRYNGFIYENVPNAPCIRDGLVVKDRFWGIGEEGIFNVEEGAEGYYDSELGIFINGYYRNGSFIGTTYTGVLQECHAYTAYVCGPNDIEDWGYHGEQLGTFFEFDPYIVSTTKEPNRITGIETFSESIIVFKTGENPRIYRIDGSDTASFQSTLLKEGSACWNENTVAATSVGLFYLAKDGVFVVTGGQEVITLASSKFNKRMLEDLKKPNVEGVYDSLNGLYIIGCDKTFYVFNVLSKGWFKWESLNTINCIRNLERGIYFGTDKGTVLFYNDTSHKDYSETAELSTPITTTVETASYSFKQPGVSKFIKYCYLIFECNKDVNMSVEFFSKQAGLAGVGVIDEYDIYNNKVRTATESTRVGDTNIKTIKLNIEDPETFWDDPLYIFDSTLTNSIESYRDQFYPWDLSNGAYAWDGEVIPIPGDTTYSAYMEERVLLEEQLGIYYTYFKARFDGRAGVTVQLKIPVGTRDTNVTLRLKFEDAPVTLQELVFDGASTRPAP